MTADQLIARLEDLARQQGIPLDLLEVADAVDHPHQVTTLGGYVSIAPDPVELELEALGW